MSIFPGNLSGSPITHRDLLEDLIRARFNATHPDDTFDDFKRRSRFDKHDKGLMKDWLALAYAELGSVPFSSRKEK